MLNSFQLDQLWSTRECSVIGQGLLQRLRLFLGRVHPHVAFLPGCQDNRHCLGMDGLGDGVRTFA
jgi:hypothetical protein